MRPAGQAGAGEGSPGHVPRPGREEGMRDGDGCVRRRHGRKTPSVTGLAAGATFPCRGRTNRESAPVRAGGESVSPTRGGVNRPSYLVPLPQGGVPSEARRGGSSSPGREAWMRFLLVGGWGGPLPSPACGRRHLPLQGKEQSRDHQRGVDHRPRRPPPLRSQSLTHVLPPKGVRTRRTRPTTGRLTKPAGTNGRGHLMGENRRNPNQGATSVTTRRVRFPSASARPRDPPTAPCLHGRRE